MHYPHLQAAQAATRHYPIVSNQVLYHLNRREIERDVLLYCVQQRITVIAYTPLADGRLATVPTSPLTGKMQALAQVGAYTGKTLGQVALNWCTSRPHIIAIPKSNSIAQVRENC